MLEAHDIRKSYGGVKALVGANLTVRPGTVHALLGENGAGKSTLVKIIAGATRADSGVMRLDGHEVTFASTAEAARRGVAVVSQELNLFPDLDVLSNLFPMREPRRGPFVSRKVMAERALPVLRELGLEVGLRQLLGELTLAERQLVEIAKALVTDPIVLILDEPTSALETSSIGTLIGLLGVLRERQVAVVFVSHILEEVMQLCDEVTVLRDGRPVMEGKPKAQLTVRSIVEAMLGERSPPAAAQAPSGAAPARDAGGNDASQLRCEHVSLSNELQDVSFVAARGEIVGLAGLAGAGHAALIELISGQRRPDSGEVLLPGGRPVPRGLRSAIGAGVALVTGDRRRFGLMLDKPLWENIGQVRAVALARDGVRIRKGRLRELARGHLSRLGVRTPSTEALAGSLSGGSQQKVVFAKWLDVNPSVMMLDDPTRGVDVGAKSEMHSLIHSIARGDAVVLLNSTDLDELCDLCDRVLVFFEGRVCAVLTSERLVVHNVLEAMNTGRLEPEPA